LLKSGRPAQREDELRSLLAFQRVFQRPTSAEA
jgi:hypothetical protein